MMLEPDKIALATLYYLYASNDPEAECDPVGIATALQGIVSATEISDQLSRLEKLELVIGTGGILAIFDGETVPGNDWWSITDKGTNFARALVRQPKGFLGRLHAGGFPWLKKPAAAKTPLKFKLTTPHIDEVLNGPSANKSDGWTKWGTIATWIGLPIAIIAIAVSIWLDNN